MYTHIYVVLNEMRVIVYNEMKCVLQGVVRTKPFGAGNIFLILAHPVYKMWIIQEPNKLALWNKLHFEEEKTDSIEHV